MAKTTKELGYKRIAIVLSEITRRKAIASTLYDNYIHKDELPKIVVRINGTPVLSTLSKLAIDWINYLNQVSENKDWVETVDKIFKKQSITYIPLFFWYIQNPSKIHPQYYDDVVAFKDFLRSFYEIETKEEFIVFLNNVFRETYNYTMKSLHSSKGISDRARLKNIPVEDVDDFNHFFYSEDIDALNKEVPVYYYTEHLGDIDKFIHLPEEELSKHKIGVSNGFVSMTVVRDDVFIGAKFKPDTESLAYLIFKNHYNELEKLGKVKLYSKKDTTLFTHKDNVVVLTPIFETKEGKKVLKMLLFKLVV
mgnify:FL=1|jgi:hypothetical protein